MFSNDLSREDRSKALALRIEAARFEENPPPFLSEAHKELDAFIAKTAPDWLVADMANGMFVVRPLTELDAKMSELGKQFGLERLPFAASRIDFRTAFRMRAHLCDAGEVLGFLRSIHDQDEEYLRSATKAERAMRRGQHKFRASRRYTLGRAVSDEAYERRIQQIQAGTEPDAEARGTPTIDLKPVFGGRELDCGEGYTLRVPDRIEAKLIANAWEDGWLSMSPTHAAVGRVAGKMYRWEQAWSMSESAHMVGIFDSSGNPVGSLSIRPVSETEVELGWFVSAPHRNRGIATRAVSAAIRTLAEHGVEQVGALCLVSNKASIRMMEKLGFVGRADEVLMGTDIDWIGMTADTKDFLQQSAADAPARI